MPTKNSKNGLTKPPTLREGVRAKIPAQGARKPSPIRDKEKDRARTWATPPVPSIQEVQEVLRREAGEHAPREECTVDHIQYNVMNNSSLLSVDDPLVAFSLHSYYLKYLSSQSPHRRSRRRPSRKFYPNLHSIQKKNGV
eukprot:TRINITY_DN10611_c0_g1_i1.p1 TRINITY_DN10611_c0_g1~~TRINITY_DN10611_c0_g1_i1.p1  ORF type:complete len:154 (+),score=39.73 TRINITY_DN10611_c0_g1_i1:43-462(+)